MPENNGASNPKIHPAELNEQATRLATLADKQASGQPWQEDTAGYTTAELLETPHPDLVQGLTPSDVLGATEALSLANPPVVVDETSEEAPVVVDSAKKKPTAKKKKTVAKKR